MTPSFAGRIQTRLFLTFAVGFLWTILITPVLPRPFGPDMLPVSLGSMYGVTLRVLVAVGVLGVGWEVVYHLLQQFRWEKDWPTMFGFLNGVNEGFFIWLLIRAEYIPGVVVPGTAALTLHFATTWVVTFLFSQGPMRVLFVRWRFQGGRLG